MTTMMMKSRMRTRSAIARLEEIAASPRVEEVLAWTAFAGFAVVGFLIFIIAIWF